MNPRNTRREKAQLPEQKGLGVLLNALHRLEKREVECEQAGFLRPEEARKTI
jgi:hypothetical protein